MGAMPFPYWKRLVKPFFPPIFLLASLGSAGVLSDSESSRRDSAWTAANPYSLPRWETLQERRVKSEYFARRKSPALAASLQAPLRYVAEYERMAGVIIRYPFGISLALIR